MFICKVCGGDEYEPMYDIDNFKCSQCGVLFSSISLKYNTNNIKVMYHTDVYEIEQLEVGDWIDLSVIQDYDLGMGDFKYLKLGVSMELPKNHEALLVPRSSTYKRYKVIQPNSPGVIDESYCGDDDMWRFPALATEDTFIPKGARICQFRIQPKMLPVTFETVDSLQNENRGGLGSTGK